VRVPSEGYKICLVNITQNVRLVIGLISNKGTLYLPAHQLSHVNKTAILLPFPVTTMASSGRAMGLGNNARLRPRSDQGSSHTPSLTSDNNQNNERAAAIYQSPVSD